MTGLYSLRRLGVGLFLVLLASPAWAQTNTLRRYTVLEADAGRVDFCRTTNVLLYDKEGGDSLADVYKANADGTGDVNLTDGIHAGHAGNPVCSPDGQWIAYQAANDEACLAATTKPGRGQCNDVWIMTAAGTTHTLLYDTSGRGAEGGILHIHFLPDGRMYFTSRIQAGTPLAEWEICIGALSTVGTPSLSGVTCAQPCSGLPDDDFYETHGPLTEEVGEDRILTTAICDDATPALADLSIYVYDFSAGTLTLLIGDGQWNEHAQMSPCGSVFAYMSSSGNGWDGTSANLRADWWLGRTDGTVTVRLTKWGLASASQYSGATPVVAADLVWDSCDSFVGYRITDTINSVGEVVRVQLANRGRPPMRAGGR